MKTITLKLVLLITLLFFLQQSLYSQNYWKTKPAPSLEELTKNKLTNMALRKSQVAAGTLAIDTLWYFWIKHYYRNSAPLNVNAYSFLDYPSSQGIGNPLTGAYFSNPGTMTVTGLEVLASRRASSPSPGVPINLYLCHVNSAGLPLLPAIDSVVASVNSTNVSGISGADFVTPRVVTGNFAVLVNVASTAAPGDTMLLIFNNALTANSTNPNNSAKYGESRGIGRPPGSPFIKLTNVFGAGTDSEPLVAPRVTFSINVSAGASSTNPCVGASAGFSNMSSPYLSHREYNKNAFYRYWGPFGYANTAAEIQPDSVFVWNFGDGSGNHFNNSAAGSHSFATQGIYTVSLTANYQRSRTHTNFSSKVSDTYTFQVAAKDCSNTTGISAIAPQQTVILYPNPTENGKCIISGLFVGTKLKIYNAMGQLLFAKETSAEDFVLDLTEQPTGTYFLKITANDYTEKIFKIVN